MFKQFKVLVTIDDSRRDTHIITALDKEHAEIIVRTYYAFKQLPYESIVALEAE